MLNASLIFEQNSAGRRAYPQAPVVEALVHILKEAQTQPELLHNAPHTLPVKRLDEVKAARKFNLKWESHHDT